jgi:hypothetical protein
VVVVVRCSGGCLEVLLGFRQVLYALAKVMNEDGGVGPLLREAVRREPGCFLAAAAILAAAATLLDNTVLRSREE